MKARWNRCYLCSEQAVHFHHLFPKTKESLKLYGKKLMDNRKNLIPLCEQCHLFKPVPRITEEEFCRVMEIQPRSKTAMLGGIQ